MKHLFIALTLASTIFTATHSSNAQAFGIVNLLSTGRLDYVGVPRTHADMLMTTVCIVLLPFCILDQNSAGVEGLTANDLLANGYSSQEVAAILEGQKAFADHLSINNLKVTQEGTMTKLDLAQFASAVAGVTPEYVQFISEN